jgi:hypothetical protein
MLCSYHVLVRHQQEAYRIYSLRNYMYIIYTYYTVCN